MKGLKNLVLGFLLSSFLFCVSSFAVTVSIPQVYVNPGTTTVEIPVEIDDATNVVAFVFEITYNKDVLDWTNVIPGTLTQGLVLNSDWAIIKQVDENIGKIQIVGAALTTPPVVISGGSGSLVKIKFNIIGQPADTSQLNFITENDASVVSKYENGQISKISATFQNGSFHIDGYSISGTVTLSGGTGNVTSVTLNLTGAKTSTTNPSSNGNYSFTDLPPGDYTITPTLNGYVFSPQNRQVTITNSNVTGQDFTGNALCSVSGTISYAGQSSGTIYIGLFTSSDFSGQPAYGTTIQSPGNYQIQNVAPGTYYAGAFMDVNGNGQWDQNTEPSGVYLQNPFTLTSGQNKTGVNITLKEPLTLTVISEHNSCTPTGSPAPGQQHVYYTGDVVNASVTSPVSGPSGTRYVCTGGTGTGSAPATLNVGAVNTFTITQNSTITWNWKTQYLLTYSVDPAGSGTITVNPTSSGNWYDQGQQVTLTPSAGQNYIFQYWILDGEQVEVEQLNITMNSPHTVVAKFALNQPQLSVTPTQLSFYFNINDPNDPMKKQEIIKVENTGSGEGTLDWQVEGITYQQGNNWITVYPTSGNLPAQTSQDVEIEVNRTGMNIGKYYATISITSNGGNQNVNVEMIINQPPVAEAISPDGETTVDTGVEFCANFTSGAGTIDRSEWKIYEGVPAGRVNNGNLIKTVQTKGAVNKIILPYSLFKEGQNYRWTVQCWDNYEESSNISEKTFSIHTKENLPVSEIDANSSIEVSLPDSTTGETALVTNSSAGIITIRPLQVSSFPPEIRQNFANLFDIRVEGIVEGDIAKITFEIPGNYNEWAKILYDNENQEWVLKLMPKDETKDEYAKLTPSTTPGWTKIELQLKDGGEYDFDGTANGVIVDPSGAVQGTSHVSGGCFIATACFGNYNHPIVKILREFRDKFLLTNKIGKMFVKWYYSHSPKYAEIISRSSVLRGIVRLLLVPFVIFAYLCVKGLILPLILVSLSLILFRRKSIKKVLPILIFFLILSSNSFAQDINLFKIMPGEKYTISTPTRFLLEKGKFQVDLIYSYADKVLEGIVGSQEQDIITSQHLIQLGLTLGLTDKFNVSILVPYLINQKILEGQPFEDSGVGDIYLIGKFKILDSGKEGIVIVVIPYFGFESGNENALIGANSMVYGIKFSIDKYLTDKLIGSINLGYSHQDAVNIGQVEIKNTFLFGGSLIYLINDNMYIAGEIVGRTDDGFFKTKESTPVEALVSLGWNLKTCQFILGAGAGIVDGYGASNWRAFAGIKAGF